MDSFRGLLIQGDATVIDDDAEKLRIARDAARERGLPEADWPADPPRGTLIRIQRRRITSWFPNPSADCPMDPPRSFDPRGPQSQMRTCG